MRGSIFVVPFLDHIWSQTVVTNVTHFWFEDFPYSFLLSNLST